MKSEFTKIKKTKVSNLVVEQFEQMITNGSFKPGDKLPSEKELMNKLGISRSSVREAMISLESMGIIDIRRGEGTFLNDNSNIIMEHFKVKFLLKQYNVEEIIEARILLETQIVKLAIEKLQTNNIADIEKYHLNMIMYKEQMDKFIENDFKFHLSIARATKNEYLVEMLKTTRGLLYEVNKIVVLKPGQIQRALESHYNIIEAMKQGNKEIAAKEMKNNIMSMKGDYL